LWEGVWVGKGMRLTRREKDTKDGRGGGGGGGGKEVDAIMITSTIRIMRGRGFGWGMPQGHALALMGVLDCCSITVLLIASLNPTFCFFALSAADVRMPLFSSNPHQLVIRQCHHKNPLDAPPNFPQASMS